MARTFGDWDKAERLLKRAPSQVRENLKRATARNASHMRDAVKKKIRDGDPSWAPVSPLTAERKGSSKPLIDHGDLMNSVIDKRISTTSFFIGVPRNAKSESGVRMVNIAAVLFHGATIKPKRGRALAIPLSRDASRLATEYNGVRNIPGLFRPEGTRVLALPSSDGFEPMFYLMPQVVIPPRDPVAPAVREESHTVVKRWNHAIAAALQGRVYV